MTASTTPSAEVALRRHPLSLALLASLALLVIGTTACIGGGSTTTGPEQPTFSYVIPAGSAAHVESGGTLDILPGELITELGETIQIVNEDDRPHFLGPWFVGPGETLRQRFVTPGVFEGTCSVHPSGEFRVVVEPTDEA